MKYNVTSRALVFAALCATCEAVARTGSFAKQPLDATPAMGFDFSFFGEGIEYDTTRDRVLLGTLNSGGPDLQGKIYAVPYSNSLNGIDRVVYDESDMELVFPGDDRILSIAGLQMDNIDPSTYVWAATAYFPPTATTPCGVAKINYVTGVVDAYYNFSSLSSSFNGYKCMSNDLIFDATGNLFVTDFYGYQVFKVALATDSSVSVAYSDTSYLCVGSECPPSAGNDYALNGPNGIEFINNNLIVAVSPSRIVKINLADDSYTTVMQIPSDGIQGADGIIFSPDKSQLFIAGYGESGSILKATSDDSWNSMYIHTAYNAACTNDGSTSVGIAGNDVMIYCSNNFGAAPYNVSVVPNALISKPGAMSLSSSITTTGLTPEGIEFDRAMNRVIISSMNGGNITGATASAVGIAIDQSSSYLYASGTSQVSSTVGLQLAPRASDNDNARQCYMYACVGFGTGNGLAYYDICNNQLLHFFDFAAVTLASGSSNANDVIIVDEVAYITDYGGQIWRVVNPSDANSVPEVFVSSSALAPYCSTPNGIEAYNSDYLIVACGLGLIRISIEDKTIVAVTQSSTGLSNSIMNTLDGIIFDDEQEILYGASAYNGNYSTASEAADYVVAISSSDDWKTSDVLYVFRSDCPDGYVATLAYSGSSLYALCTDNFGAGPYNIRYINDVKDAVTDGNDIYDEDDDRQGDDSDDDNNLPGGTVIGLSVAVAVLSVLAIVFGVLFFLGAKTTPMATKDAEMSRA